MAHLVFRFEINIYNFIHHQTLIANNEKKTYRINKHLWYVNNHVQKTLLHNLYFLAKNITSFFQNSTWQVKIKLHTTISNSF